MKLTGAEIVVECLKEQGVDTVFVTPDRYADLSSTAVREQLKNGDFHSLPAYAIIEAQEIMKNKIR